MSVITKIYGNLIRKFPHIQKNCLERHFSAAPKKMNEIEKKFKLPKRYEGSEPSVW